MVDPYRCDDAELILVTSGTPSVTAQVVIDEYREQGEKVGLLAFEDVPTLPEANKFAKILAGVPKVAVMDRNCSYGHHGIWFQELKSSLYTMPDKDSSQYLRIHRRIGRKGHHRENDPAHHRANSRPQNSGTGNGMGPSIGTESRRTLQWKSSTSLPRRHSTCPKRKIYCSKGTSLARVAAPCRCTNCCSASFGKETAIVTPACCFAVIDGPFPYSAAGVPLLHTAFEASAAFASGVRAGFDMRGDKDVQVVVMAGDGGTFDIGLQALSASAERNENFVYICYDNEAYMNTGIQRSSATPKAGWTTTTPVDAPKQEAKKDIGAIMAAHRIPYFATASIAYPDDLYAKLEKAKNTKGFRMHPLPVSLPGGMEGGLPRHRHARPACGSVASVSSLRSRRRQKTTSDRRSRASSREGVSTKTGTVLTS